MTKVKVKKPGQKRSGELGAEQTEGRGPSPEEELERATREVAALRQLLARVWAGQDEWQRRVAEGLHDGVAQILVACSIKVAHLQSTTDRARVDQLAGDVERLLRRANDDIRKITVELVSSTLYRVGLEEALAELCEQLSRRHGVHFSFSSDGQRTPMPDQAATILFKATRELLHNVVEHAGVDRAAVSIQTRGGELRIAVEDRGRGFPSPSPPSPPIPTPTPGAGLAGGRARGGGPLPVPSAGGLSLFGIKERLLGLDGRLEIRSTPNGRTVVALIVPVGPEKQGGGTTSQARGPGAPVRT